MKRRPLTKAQLLDRMPRAFRRPLDASQRQQLEMCHLVNLDAIATGLAEPGILWDWVGSVLVWLRVAQRLQAGELEMAGQLDVATRMVERYGRTGRVRCDGPDYQMAKIGAMVMQQLADMVDQPTAAEACDRSEAEVNRMAASVTAWQAEHAQEAQAA